MSNTSSNSSPTVLLGGLAYVESPRWHEGRLWFAHWGTGEIVAVDLDGNSEVTGHGPAGLGWTIDWLPDGRLLVTGKELLRREPDGSMVQHVDLSGIAPLGCNDIVVDGRGNTYVNGSDFNFGGGPFMPGVIALVTPDGSVRQVADDIHFPNGMVVTPDNKTLIVTESFTARLTAFDIAQDGSLSNRRVWAELGQGGDGMCLDAEGAIWTPAFKDGKPGCNRVREGGEVLQRIELDQFCFACMLGGTDGQTLFMLIAEWRGVEHMAELFQSHTGQVLTARVAAPHAGRP